MLASKQLTSLKLSPVFNLQELWNHGGSWVLFFKQKPFLLGSSLYFQATVRLLFSLWSDFQCLQTRCYVSLVTVPSWQSEVSISSSGCGVTFNSCFDLDYFFSPVLFQGPLFHGSEAPLTCLLLHWHAYGWILFYSSITSSLLFFSNQLRRQMYPLYSLVSLVLLNIVSGF